MSTDDAHDGPPQDGPRRRRPTLSDRVDRVPADPHVAFVPGRVLVRGAEAEKRVPRDASADRRIELGPRPRGDERRWISLDGVEDPVTAAELVRADGFDAQLEHVFFAHGCDPCAAIPHPSLSFEALKAAPFRANPFRANPFRANPFRANPFRANDALTNSAMPALGRVFPVRALEGPGTHPRVTVLDTGLAGGTDADGVTDPDGQRPALLQPAPPDTGRISGPLDLPDAGILSPAGAVVPPDDWLDPVAGHGTFIAGLVEQLAPGCHVRVEQVVGPLGDAREGDVCDAILHEAALPPEERPQILSMSFGGRVLESAWALRSAVARARAAGIVLVASAGNEGSPLPQFPAAFDQVVAVGALGPDGPAPWTNYGGWVDACAPGVDLVSAFFAAFNGPSLMVNTVDPDDFAAWATWSGTSFAAPMVVAALAREMVIGACGAELAVDRVVRAPQLLRMPCLGTVVNV